MKKPSITIRMLESDEFQARQLAFDFGYVARAVLPVIRVMHQKLTRWLAKWAAPEACARPSWIQGEFAIEEAPA